MSGHLIALKSYKNKYSEKCRFLCISSASKNLKKMFLQYFENCVACNPFSMCEITSKIILHKTLISKRITIYIIDNSDSAFQVAVLCLKKYMN